MCVNLIPGHIYYEHSFWLKNWVWHPPSRTCPMGFPSVDGARDEDLIMPRSPVSHRRPGHQARPVRSDHSMGVHDVSVATSRPSRFWSWARPGVLVHTAVLAYCHYGHWAASLVALNRFQPNTVHHFPFFEFLYSLKYSKNWFKLPKIIENYINFKKI
jgi:hypothetical protein